MTDACVGQQTESPWGGFSFQEPRVTCLRVIPGSLSRLRERLSQPRERNQAGQVAGTSNTFVTPAFAKIMSKSIRAIRKRKYVRQKRPLEPGTVICLRLQRKALEQLDLWIIKQDDLRSRPEAARRLLAKALGKPK